MIWSVLAHTHTKIPFSPVVVLNLVVVNPCVFEEVEVVVGLVAVVVFFGLVVVGLGHVSVVCWNHVVVVCWVVSLVGVGVVGFFVGLGAPSDVIAISAQE